MKTLLGHTSYPWALLLFYICASGVAFLTQQAGQAQEISMLKLAHEDYRNPVSFVVPLNTSEKQLEGLVLVVQSAIRSHQYGRLGLQAANAKNRYDVAGMIEIYRGRKCLAESYTDGPTPCGEGDHYDAFYQWGLDGLTLDTAARFACDSGGYRKRDQTLIPMFTGRNGCVER